MRGEAARGRLRRAAPQLAGIGASGWISPSARRSSQNPGATALSAARNVVDHLVRAAAADRHRIRDVGSHGEADRGGHQVRSVVVGDGADAIALAQHGGVDDGIVVGIHVLRLAGEEAVAERRADHHAVAMRPQRRKHRLDRVVVVDQRILTGHQVEIGIGIFHASEDRLGTVHAHAPCLDHALRPKIAERAERALDGAGPERRPVLGQGGVIGRQVVNEDHVDRVDPHPLQAVLDRPPRPIGAVIVDLGIGRGGMGKERLVAVFAPGLQEPADLGRQDIAVARLAMEKLAVAPLRKAEAVEGGDVEISHPGLPGGAKRVLRLRIGGDGELVADGHAAQAEPVGDAVALAAGHGGLHLGGLGFEAVERPRLAPVPQAGPWRARDGRAAAGRRGVARPGSAALRPRRGGRA